MSKWAQLKEAMKNPPEERLCLINARGYKIGMLAIFVICIVLLQTIVWYISVIFIFQIVNNWVGYKREMNQYNRIIEARKTMGTYQEIGQDPSFTRRRFRKNEEVYGAYFKYFLLVTFAFPAVLVKDFTSFDMYVHFIYAFLVLIIFMVWYLYPCYWIARLVDGKDRN